MKKKKSILFPILMLLFSALFIAAMPTDAEGALYKDTIRLHILANSDSEEDQALKLYIRDAVLSEFSSELSSSQSTEAAREKTLALLSDIERFAEKKCAEAGYSYAVCAELGTEWYDTREYENFTLPRGYYESLRIIIGEGEGQNWWCVMFPPLCLDIATENAPFDDGVKKYTDEEFTLITKRGYNAKFKILELISEAFK